MPTTQRALSLITTSTVLSLALVNAQSAEAAILPWSLTFLDNSGVQVGTGAFSYDDEKVVVVREGQPFTAFYIGGKDDPIRPDFIPGPWTLTVFPNPVESFVANLPGVSWDLTFTSWWAPEGPRSTLGSFQFTRPGLGLVSDTWFGGSPAGFPPGQFVMFGGQPLGDNRYSGGFISAPVASPPSSFVSGRWIATPVPEPTTLAGAAMVGTGLLVARKRRSSH
jgi:hypothetical protein